MKTEDCIFFQLAKTSQEGTNFWAAKVAHLNVTPVQAMVLNFLGEEDSVTSHELGGRLRITSATMTGILDRLEKMSLVERKPHPEDGRAVQVCLTEKGCSCAREIRGISEQANAEFLDVLTLDETAFFRSILRRLKDR